MSHYDRQLILAFLGAADEDAVTRDEARSLEAKAQAVGLESVLLEVPSFRASGGPAPPWLTQLKSAVVSLTPASRLYVVGHGDWQRQTVGDWDGEQAADLLTQCGLAAVKVISITASEAGRDLGTTVAARIAEPANSFASRFHRRLRETHGLEQEIRARVFAVRVLAKAGDPDRGRKATGDASTDYWFHGRSGSKLRFRWADGKQVRTWVDYGPNADRPF